MQESKKNNNMQTQKITITHINQYQILINHYCQFSVLTDGLVNEIQRRKQQKKIFGQTKKRIKIDLRTCILGRGSFNEQNQDKSYLNLHNKLTVIFNNYIFHKIDTLYLDNFNLYSYQFLQFIDWPNLKTIKLTNNKAHNLQSLIKANLPSLTHLGLYQNLVQQQLRLQRFHFKKINLIITIDEWSPKWWLRPPYMNQDMSFVAKMQLRKVAQVQFNMQIRMKQPQVNSTMLKKISSLERHW